VTLCIGGRRRRLRSVAASAASFASAAATRLRLVWCVGARNQYPVNSSKPSGRILRPIRLALVIGETYSQVAMERAATLDRTFRALADRHPSFNDSCPARGEARSASELGRHFRSAQPTISNHLKVLEQAGLVERTIEGRIHRFRLRSGAARGGRWITRHQAFWNGAVDQLDRLLPKSQAMIEDDTAVEVRRRFRVTRRRICRIRRGALAGRCSHRPRISRSPC